MGIDQCYWRYNDIIETGGGSIKVCSLANSSFPMSC
ncbi:hypothetical protein T12_15661 [Trichinella patagoniensis]|uniref:Uncharacterized protein n=1 Tax=Trichinella patagoniensis TaxID=990121 RepID=A0A0V0WKD5_9BILA|nr:hypothetical protein T12_15661 [Trichinella patagoniensis]